MFDFANTSKSMRLKLNCIICFISYSRDPSREASRYFKNIKKWPLITRHNEHNPENNANNI